MVVGQGQPALREPDRARYQKVRRRSGGSSAEVQPMPRVDGQRGDEIRGASAQDVEKLRGGGAAIDFGGGRRASIAEEGGRQRR